MDETVKRWTAKRKTALVIEIIQGKTTVVEASRTYDLTPSVNLVRFIVRPQVGSDSNRWWRKNPVAGQDAHRT